MKRKWLWISMIAACVVPNVWSQTHSEEKDPEKSTIPPEAFNRLAASVQSMVDNEQIVGGELLVIKDRKTLFRKVFGWKDKESGTAMPVDAVYCVRSMTKPLVGTAIQMLIDEGKLSLNTHVRDILPFFNGPETGKITIEHLLTHSGGFPFTTLRQRLDDYKDLAAVAAEAVQTELLFTPGARFEYSDAGSDTLGAVVTKVSGTPVEKFIQQRILDPLGMKDTYTLLDANMPVMSRIPSAYSGGTGTWSKHWQPSDPPIFPIFLTSQSLYATTTDYARFLALWMDNGLVQGQRLLSPQAITRGLSPHQAIPQFPGKIGNLDAHYGHQWLVHTQPGEPRPMVFGHDGSDGTYAWVWPQEDMMALFFTQSRGTLAGLALSKELQTLLVERKLPESTRSKGTDSLEDYAGLYWDETAINAYYVVKPRGDRLTMERPGRMYWTFKPGEAADRFVHEMLPNAAIEFLRDAEGKVSTMRTLFGNNVENDPKHTPLEGLPSADEVIAMVRRAHGLDRLSELGVVRMTGQINFETRGMKGPIEAIFDDQRERTEVQLGNLQEIVVKNKNQAWQYNSTTGLDELTGPRLETALLDRFSTRFGDWTGQYETIDVLKRLDIRDRSLLLVRVVPREGFGATMIVDEESGLLVRTDSIIQIPGMGVVGVETSYRDYRDVGGMKLPFMMGSKFATQLVGRVITTFEEAETSVSVSDDTFARPEPVE